MLAGSSSFPPSTPRTVDASRRRARAAGGGIPPSGHHHRSAGGAVDRRRRQRQRPPRRDRRRPTHRPRLFHPVRAQGANGTGTGAPPGVAQIGALSRGATRASSSPTRKCTSRRSSAHCVMTSRARCTLVAAPRSWRGRPPPPEARPPGGGGDDALDGQWHGARLRNALAEVVAIAAAEFAKEHGPNAAVVLGAASTPPTLRVSRCSPQGVSRRPPEPAHHRGERRAPELWRRPRRRRRGCALSAAPSLVGVRDGARGTSLSSPTSRARPRRLWGRSTICGLTASCTPRASRCCCRRSTCREDGLFDRQRAVDRVHLQSLDDGLRLRQDFHDKPRRRR